MNGAQTLSFPVPEVSSLWIAASDIYSVKVLQVVKSLQTVSDRKKPSVSVTPGLWTHLVSVSHSTKVPQVLSEVELVDFLM